MNKGGLQNKAGEILKELDDLLENIAPKRKELSRAKYSYEKAQNSLEDLQQYIWHNLSVNPETNWENPNPILDTDGKPMPEFEAQYRMNMISFLIQTNETFAEAMQERDMQKDAYYTADAEVVTLMERIGVLKAELGALTALVRLADES